MSPTETRIKFVHWQSDLFWLGYLVDFPDYLTQGETLDELRENLRDLYLDLTSGEIQGVRRIDELVVA
jgi:predicted RNase H-like HicB family nuclease